MNLYKEFETVSKRIEHFCVTSTKRGCNDTGLYRHYGMGGGGSSAWV